MKRSKSQSRQLGFEVQTSTSRGDSEDGCRDARPCREVSENVSLSPQPQSLMEEECYFLTGWLEGGEIEMRTEEYEDPLRRTASEISPPKLRSRSRVKVDLRLSLVDWEIGSTREGGGWRGILLR